MDIGCFFGIILWPLLATLHRIHVRISFRLTRNSARSSHILKTHASLTHPQTVQSPWPHITLAALQQNPSHGGVTVSYLARAQWSKLLTCELPESSRQCLQVHMAKRRITSAASCSPNEQRLISQFKQRVKRAIRLVHAFVTSAFCSRRCDRGLSTLVLKDVPVDIGRQRVQGLETLHSRPQIRLADSESQAERPCKRVVCSISLKTLACRFPTTLWLFCALR